MQFFDLESRLKRGERRGRWDAHRWRQVCAGLVFAAAFTCAAQDGQPAAPAGTGIPAQTQAASSTAGQAASEAKQTKQHQVQAADSQRKKQISDDSTQLLAMALALKAEVDKTNKDVLSLNVIRKADEIERLAHSVKERIKQGSGPGQDKRGTVNAD